MDDPWLYWEVTHSAHVFCNPLGEARVDELIDVLDLGRDARVLDIACGHGELLVRLAERYGCGGVGVDCSPYVQPRARQRHAGRVPGADLVFVEQKGEDFATEERFDVAACVGASWIWAGFAGTLEALRSFCKPGGLVLSGEPYWRGDPPDEYLAADGLTREGFGTLAQCRATALDLGLEVVWMAGSTDEEWDRYEMLQAAAVDRFARANPEHPDLAAIRERRRQADEIYVRWGRRHCGWALWVFRCP